MTAEQWDKAIMDPGFWQGLLAVMVPIGTLLGVQWGTARFFNEDSLMPILIGAATSIATVWLIHLLGFDIPWMFLIGLLAYAAFRMVLDAI